MRGVSPRIVSNRQFNSPPGQDAQDQEPAEKPQSATKYPTENIPAQQELNHPGSTEQEQCEKQHSSENVRSRRSSEVAVGRGGDRRRQPAGGAGRPVNNHSSTFGKTKLRVGPVSLIASLQSEPDGQYRPARRGDDQTRQTQNAALAARSFRAGWACAIVRHGSFSLAGSVL